MKPSQHRKKLLRPRESSSSAEDDSQMDTSQVPRTANASADSLDGPNNDLMTELIDDGIDQYDFDMLIEDRVHQIEAEMLTYGDAQLDTNDLRNVEFRIQSERILAVLDRCIEQVNLMFQMPSFLLSSTECHVEALQQMAEVDRTKLKEMYVAFSTATEMMNRTDLTTLSVHMDQAIQVANKYNLMKWFPIEFNSIPFAAYRFTNQLRALRDLAEHRIKWTAPKAMAKEKRLHAMWNENLETSVKVQELRVQVCADQAALKKKVNDNEALLNVRQEKIRQMNEDNLEKIAKTIYESNLKMNKTSIDSEAKQTELLQRANEARSEYETMLQANLANGKKLRENKLKAEQKLQSWLQKYDTDVGDRNQELFGLKDELEEENAQLERWMRKYEEQEEEYHAVLALVHEQYIKERDEKVRIFTLEHAAKKIQRAVRRMIKKKKQRRKNKGKKGKN